MKSKFKPSAILLTLLSLTGLTLVARVSSADPSRYPQFAQQNLPETVTPAFISIDELVTAVKAGTKPLIIDVRSAEEFQESHILGSVSAPLRDFADYIDRIPRDRLVVLY